ncbi:MAG: CinA family protein [Oscillospiraceae bacterium]
MNKWQKIVDEFTRQNLTISTVESCTGGFLAGEITKIPGASKVFFGGLVTYSNELKSRLLNIDVEIINKYTAVSPKVATLMAEHGRKLMQTDFCIAVTGYAGPWAPEVALVGQVFIAISKEGTTKVWDLVKMGSLQELSRDEIRLKTISIAADFVSDFYN